MSATGSIVVVPDPQVVQASSRAVVVTVTAADVPLGLRPRASLITYAPDGTMLRSRPRNLRGGSVRFRRSFGRTRQPGTYTVYATVEVDSQAFGMPSTFEVAAD
jgi:hypothetical protein